MFYLHSLATAVAVTTVSSFIVCPHRCFLTPPLFAPPPPRVFPPSVLRRLFVALIVFCYAVIAPIVLPVACLLYYGSYLVYKNQALFVYVQTAESGGAVSPRSLSTAIREPPTPELYVCLTPRFALVYSVIPRPAPTRRHARGIQMVLVTMSCAFSGEARR